MRNQKIKNEKWKSMTKFLWLNKKWKNEKLQKWKNITKLFWLNMESKKSKITKMKKYRKTLIFKRLLKANLEK